jgi:hypothetical protein
MEGLGILGMVGARQEFGAAPKAYRDPHDRSADFK